MRRRRETEIDDAFWEEAMTLNFLAARRLTDLITPGMKARNWGRIVNISGALVAPKLNGAAPAKAALVSWSRTLSSEGFEPNCDTAAYGSAV
jgi:3-oxoacyl-[acyl-carrier protein] reductase